MKIILIGNLAESLISFRGELISEFVHLGHEVTVCSPGDNVEVANTLLAMGAVYRSLEFNRTSTNPLGDVAFFLDLIALFKEIKPDIVLNYTIKPIVYGSLAAKFTGVRYVYSVITGLGYFFLGETTKQKLLRLIISPLYRLAIASNKAIFFLNSDDGALFAKLKFIKDSTHSVRINGEGLDLCYYSLSSSEKYSGLDAVPRSQLSGKISFLMISRLIRDKGVHEFVAAARILKKSYPNVEFLLLGPLDSNPSAISASLLNQWVAEGVIEYLGVVKDVRPYIARCSVYVLPSYREGVPRSALEAMAMQCPIITTNAPGCRETVIEGVNGFLVPIKDADSLAEAMAKFIAQPHLVKIMGKRSRQIAEENYDVHKVNAVILKAMGLCDEESF